MIYKEQNKISVFKPTEENIYFRFGELLSIYKFLEVTWYEGTLQNTSIFSFTLNSLQ